MAAPIENLLGSVIGASRDDIIFKEIFNVIQRMKCEGGVPKIMSKIFAGIPKIVVFILLKHYVSDTSVIVSFLKTFGWNLAKSFIYKTETFSLSQNAGLDYYIALEVDKELFSYVRTIPIYKYKPEGKNVIIIEYAKGIHNEFIKNIKERAQIAYLESQSTSTTFYKYVTSYNVQTPCHFFSSNNYKKLEKIIKSDVETSNIIKSFGVMGILIDGVPGLGKSSFAEYLATQNIVSNVYKVDLSIKQCLNSTDANTIFESVFHKIPISASTVFLIDEMDKYLDYFIRSSYDKIPEKKDEETKIIPKISFEEHSKRVRIDFLYSLLSILERTGLTKSCVVIFCSNNFNTIFEGLDMTHFDSILDRFIRIKFEKCDKQEIIDYMTHYNNKFKDTDFYTDNLPLLFNQIHDDISITYRHLHQIAKISSYNFQKMIALLNNKTQTPPSSPRTLLTKSPYVIVGEEEDDEEDITIPKKLEKEVYSIVDVEKGRHPLIPKGVFPDEEDIDEEEDITIPKISSQDKSSEISTLIPDDYDHRKDESLPQSIRDISLDGFNLDETDESKFVIIYNCVKCELHSLNIFCECEKCIKLIDSSKIVAGTVVKTKCHDCVLMEEGKPSQINNLKDNKPFTEEEKLKMVNETKILLAKVAESRMGDNMYVVEKRRKLAVLIYVNMFNNYMHIVNGNQYHRFRQTVVEKILEFFHEYPGFVTSNKEFFSKFLNGLLPYKSMINVLIL
jgi:hypothetical protein